MIAVLDRGERIEYSFEDLMRYHGPSAPGGVAHAVKVMERAWPELDGAGAPERREIGIRTAFGGPGARDAFEMVTRAVSEDRYVVDPELARAELGRVRERFVFALSYRDRSVTLQVREGFVTEEFIDLARKEPRNADEEGRLTQLKREMAERVMAASAADVYEPA